jgi:hypothetical protein
MTHIIAAPSPLAKRLILLAFSMCRPHPKALIRQITTLSFVVNGKLPRNTA